MTLRSPPDPNEISSFMNIRVADIQACYELWKSRGATFLTEPIDKYGETRCYIRDPDGYIIEVGQSKPGSRMVNARPNESICRERLRRPGSDGISGHARSQVWARAMFSSRIAGIGINPEDMLERNGELKDWQLHFPAIIGLDVSGTVVATGDGVTDLIAGDRVCGWSYHTYAEFVADKASFSPKFRRRWIWRCGRDSARGRHRKPIDLRRKQRAVWPDGAGLRRGRRLGRCAVYMAKVLGARVIAGALRSQLDQAESIGPTRPSPSTTGRFAAIRQVDVVANTLHGTPAAELLAKVKDGGTFASVTGEPDGAENYPKVRVVPFRSKQNRADIAFVADAVNCGKMTIPIGLREELKNAGAAQAAFAKGGIGKVLLTP